MKNTKKGFVQMPTQTLNALKNMLFTNEGGVDLSNIINDIVADDEHRDLIAIHVALVHKGVTIDIDKATRYEHSWRNNITKHEYLGYSLILSIVKVQSYDCHIDENGDLVVDRKRDGISCYGFDQWAEWTTNVADLLDKIQK
jgi:hypothetical protein